MLLVLSGAGAGTDIVAWYIRLQRVVLVLVLGLKPGRHLDGDAGAGTQHCCPACVCFLLNRAELRQGDRVELYCVLVATAISSEV